MTTAALRVLAVDDEPLILMTLVDMLEDLGHTAVSASSGKEALERLATQPFDVLLTDQSMPLMSGDQLIARAMAIDPSLAFILATGYSETPAALSASVVKLSKPYSDGSLAAALKQVLPCA